MKVMALVAGLLLSGGCYNYIDNRYYHGQISRGVFALGHKAAAHVGLQW